MKKTLSTILLIGALGLGLGMNGCEPPTKKYYNQSIKTPTNSYEFKKYGQVDGVNNEITQIKSVDLDGDGDLDIVVGTNWGDIFIYENKIPQKE